MVVRSPRRDAYFFRILLGLFLLVFYAYAPGLLGSLDQPIDNRLVIPVFLAFVVIFTVGAVLGGTAWIMVMSRFLPKPTMHKWLTYGPQIKPLLSLNLRLLDHVYGK